MSKKKILILGAGIYQCPLIKEANKRGMETIVCSIKGNYPGFKLASKVYYADIVDKEKILEVAKKENIDAILTTGTDVAVGTIGFVCDALSLCGISYNVAIGTTDKAIMKEKFIKGKVRTAQFHKVENLEEARYYCNELGYPIMVKCVDKSGSRGICKIQNESELKSAFEEALSISNKNYVVIEKFIEGTEIGLDGFVFADKEHYWPHEKLVWDNGAAKVPVGHIMPYINSHGNIDDVLEQAKLAIDALGLNHCFFNMDIMIDNNGQAHIIEVGARMGATCIPEVLGMYFDVNMYSFMIDFALGKVDEFPMVGDGVSGSQLLFTCQEGYLENYNEEIISNEEMSIVSLDFKKGEKLPAFKVGPDRIGQIVQKANTREELLGQISEKIKALNIKKSKLTDHLFNE